MGRGGVSDYLVRFVAVNPGPLDGDSERRLTAALSALPGLAGAEPAACDLDARRVEGAFLIRVEQAMADAARDGSRLAKEAMNAAGMPDAKLIDLRISLTADDG